MRRMLLLALVTFASAVPAGAQKISSVLGNGWIGEVVSADDATRKIVIRSTEKGATETFTGFLEKGYKVKTEDGGLRELKLSDIEPGTRVRVFYKTERWGAGERRAVVNSIFRLDFLGRDEHARLREVLSLEPSAPVAAAESDGLPAANPLKVYLAVESPFIRDRFVAWAGRWNKERGAKYGSVELVTDLAQADIALVVYRGSETTAAEFPTQVYGPGGNAQRAAFSHATAYVVTRAGGGLKVLWKRVIVNAVVEGAESASAEIEKEFEKRMKGRR